MREEKRGEITSPLATAEDIYRRLVRPSSLRSQLPTSTSTEDVPSDVGWRYKAISLIPYGMEEEEEEKTRKTKKLKLEDYLDPALLSEISTKISRPKKIPATKKPIMEDQDMVNKAYDSTAITATATATPTASVDLKDDDEEEEEEEEDESSSSSSSCSSPFRHFELIASKRFNN
ncbi:hypothetical protein TorRG33x02_243360 [Trema orientale]|uniref:Uncharacterized protein n=1 Tax=Trema orientale TaxID=63057 RepID=A0A2P5DS73_TREOI|nr:hypothetical protein TorRG33x02_243360 [Trema orientale]